jgi:hypothetical protein
MNMKIWRGWCWCKKVVAGIIGSPQLLFSSAFSVCMHT